MLRSFWGRCNAIAKTRLLNPPLYTVEPITAVHGVFVWSLLFPHPAQGIAPQHIDLQVLNAGRLVSAGILLSFLRFSYLRRPF